jgi:3-hydroxyacyl-[acyl-carrier-protein] dehydratase
MKRELSLGPAVVQRLLPHRRPFLMVDTIESYERGSRPTMTASRHISANEQVFDGHFPGLPLWPGVYTIEGLGQTGNLLAIVEYIERGLVERAIEPDSLLDALCNFELGARLHPGHRPTIDVELERMLTTALPTPASSLGVSARVDVKLMAPVFAGQKLDYEVQRTHFIDSMLRFNVRATVAGREVAKGVMVAALSRGSSLEGP